MLETCSAFIPGNIMMKVAAQAVYFSPNTFPLLQSFHRYLLSLEIQ
jgi:hypothetical protein